MSAAESRSRGQRGRRISGRRTPRARDQAMAAAGGPAGVLLMAVMSLIAPGVSSQEGTLLDWCRFKPDVDRAVSVECDYSGIPPSRVRHQLVH